MAFTLAAIYATIAGSLYAHYVGFINPSAYNLEFSINYVVMLVIGGIGSVPGNVLGAILVTLVPEFLRFMENYYWLVFSIITLLFVIFLPNGIVSLFRIKRSAEKAAKGGRQMSDNREGKSVLTLKNVTKRFSGLVAVNDLSLDMKERTIHALIGPNGAGKSRPSI